MFIYVYLGYFTIFYQPFKLCNFTVLTPDFSPFCIHLCWKQCLLQGFQRLGRKGPVARAAELLVQIRKLIQQRLACNLSQAQKHLEGWLVGGIWLAYG